MVAYISKFEIENGMDTEVREAFNNRPKLVDNAVGFLRMDVLSPCDNPAEIHIITYWNNENDFEHWHRNHLKESHHLIPQGLKLVKKSWTLKKFEHITC